MKKFIKINSKDNVYKKITNLSSIYDKMTTVTKAFDNTPFIDITIKYII